MPDQLLGWIKFALTLEEKGIDFYTRCAAQTKDAHAKGLFEFLKREEYKHKSTLTTLLLNVTKGNIQKIKESAVAYEELNQAIPIFNMGDVERLTKPDTAISEMINKSMELEDEGIEFYQEVAQKEANKDVRSLFLALIKQEEEHKNIIKRFGFKLLGLSISTVKHS